MNNLENSTEITGLNFDGDNPHLAVCHKSQGYSANERTQELVRKSGVSMNIIKSLEGVPEETIKKMMYNNKRTLLEEALEEAIKSGGDSYVWVYVQDMNDTMVVFRYEEETYAVSYTSDDNSVTLGGEPVKVTHADVYKDSESGEVLIKAADWLSGNSPESNIADGESKEGDSLIETPEDDKEEIMSEDKGNVEVEKEVDEVLMKASDVADQIQEAVTKALAKKDEEIAKAVAAQKLETDTAELVKGFSFIGEDSVDELVKSLVANTEFGAVIFKALDAAKDKVDTLEAEIVKVKEEFGKGAAIEGEVKDKEINKSANKGEARTQQLEELVKAKLAAQNK